MNRFFGSLAAFVALGAFAGLSGCGGAAAPSGSSTAEGEHSEGDGHAHAEGEHAHVGPHEGDIIELGNEEYHAELVHDHDAESISIYLLGKDVKTPVAIGDAEITLNLSAGGQPMQVVLTADPQDGDGEGMASKFSVVDAAAIDAIEAEDTTGRLNVTIEDKPYIGKFAHSHDDGEHEEHDHE